MVFPNFWGAVALPLAPVSYAYAHLSYNTLRTYTMFKVHVTWNFCPQFFASLKSILQMIKNLFTAHFIPKLSGILYFRVMTSLVVWLTFRFYYVSRIETTSCLHYNRVVCRSILTTDHYICHSECNGVIVIRYAYGVCRSVILESLSTEYYTEVHLHCFLRKLYSSWFVTQQVP
jgi:hypothetical protein